MIKINFKLAKSIIKNDLIPLSIYMDYNSICNKNLFNIEHIIPQSYDKSAQSDLHLLYLAHNKINSIRSNFSFGEVYNNISNNNFSYVYVENSNIKIYNKIINKNKDFYCAFSDKYRIFVPPNSAKGIIARSLLYYRSKSYNSRVICEKILNEELMYKWNESYGVSKEEYIRNNEIYKYQNNNNPYIIFS